jgi:uncharacterized circularly permuted ATP-grasp superfamily protein/uncharacterized alpha-E superfamily protein
LAGYPAEVAEGDLYRDAARDTAARWEAMADGLLALGGRNAGEDGSGAQGLLNRQILDLGMSYRIAGERDERPWPLTPMPLIVDAAEWAGVEAGLVQRARLMEVVARDIYGPQRLVSDGHLPAAVVTGSPYFARAMVGRSGRALGRGGDHAVQVYAADLARGPGGQWRVLTDRLRLANGIGYVLENRLALSQVAGGLLAGIGARRLGPFLDALREGLAAQCQREEPRIALLTPGRFNQSYPEQAHLARTLGFPLVEGRDLTVFDDRLYVRTIGGPKRVDALWRWIDTNALDPMTFDAQSTLGVPGLFDAWARGGLELANWPGVDMLEAPAFAAFMPRLCEVLLGEAPLLPNCATWWCGQGAEAAFVRERLDELLVCPAFGGAVDGLAGVRPVALGRLDTAAQARLLASMARRPMDFCGQEIVHLSTAPVLTGERFEARAFTVRAFVARGRDGEWTVMPGGLARLSASGEISTTLMGEGDLSADVCIVGGTGGASVEVEGAGGEPVSIRRGGGILASQAADNLYWFGRYCERAEATARVVRTILENAVEAGAAPEAPALLAGMLSAWGAVGDAASEPAVAAAAALVEARLEGGVVRLLGSVRDVGQRLRDRFSPELWRIASRPAPAPTSERPGASLRAGRELVERFAALSGLMAENVVRGPVWRFLDMGRRVERALAVCRTARLLAGARDEAAAMAALLQLCDSQITYGSRYLAAPNRMAVLDLVLLDPTNPRSLVFQVAALGEHIAALPRLDDGQLPEAPERLARGLAAPLESLGVGEIDDALLGEIERRLLALSDAITARYFLQYERVGIERPTSFLA